MNRERAKELLPIIEAFANGAEIQKNDRIMRDDSKNEWYDTDDITGKGEYRIKPKPREFWVNPNANFAPAYGASEFHQAAAASNLNHYIKVREILDTT